MGNYLKPIFEIEPSYEPREAEIEKILTQIRSVLAGKVCSNITKIVRLGIGQNINFKIYTSAQNEPEYLLRIVSRNGYPSINMLKQCYELLDTKNINYSHICFYDETDTIVPYGYFVQEWVKGTDALEKYGEPENNTEWVRDFVSVLKKVHSIKPSYFGYIGEGPQYKTLQEYYYNMDEIIDSSFGRVFKGTYSIWDFDKLGLTSPGFLDNTFNKIKKLADSIKSPIEAVLVHGDTLPQNLIYSEQGIGVIDWDEARANAWVYDLARIAFYIDSKNIVESFLKYYDDKTLSINEIDIIIRLEHVRQLLRYVFMAGFNNNNIDSIKIKVKELESIINSRLKEKFL